jgi:YfiH family protein
MSQPHAPRLEMLQAPRLETLEGIRHGFFTRAGGVSQGLYASLNGGLGSADDPSHVAENRARIAAAVGADISHFATVHQVHSPDVVVATAAWDAAARPRADALVTATPGLAIAVTTADCGPVLFADPLARVIGAAHAGWRGALGGVVEATVAAMERLGAARGRIVAAIGPLIRQPSYEVGAEFAARFSAADPGYARFFIPAARAGHLMFDLGGFIAARLAAAGLAAIDDLGLCTYADPRFFSYRRSVHRGEPDYGRHLHANALTL